MNRADRKAQHKYVATFPVILTPVPREQWPWGQSDETGARTAVWCNREFLVQQFEYDGLIRLTVNRVRMQPDGHYEQGITWDELQRVKHEVGYGEAQAIEVYPPDSEVVDDANMRHLWILPEPVTVGAL